MYIRFAEEEDVEKICSLYREVSIHNGLEYDELDESTVRERILDDNCYTKICVYQDIIVGVITAHIEYSIYGLNYDHTWVDGLVTRPGYGHVLLKDVEEFAKLSNCRYIYVVHEDYDRQISNFFKRKGYEEGQVILRKTIIG